MSDGSVGKPRGIDFFSASQAVGQAARPCRFSIFAAVVGSLVLLVPNQTAESLAALCEREAPWAVEVFALAVLGWGATSWYLARVMSMFDYPDRSEVPASARRLNHGVVVWLPRALGVLPMAMVAIALVRCADRTRAVLLPATEVAALTVVFGVFVVRRRPALQKLRDALGGRKYGPLIESIWQDLDVHEQPRYRRLVDLPRATLVTLAVHASVSAVMFVAFTFQAVPTAQWLGAPTVLVASLGLWIAVGSAVAYLSSWLRQPLLLFLAIEAFAISPWTDDHVATPRPVPDTFLAARPRIPDDFASWQDATGASPRTPFVVVATEGGGIRAAYWTAALLSALQYRDPLFARRVYAISSVSGGSLGAAVFDGLVADGSSSELQTDASRILSADSLAPPLSKMLYPDFVQRFLPLATHRFDRGAALEQSWTDSFGRRVEHNVFEDPFDGVWTPKSTLPRLFLNSTWIETGKRVVLSYPRPDSFCDTVDGDTLASFSLSAAVHASARFPYISPVDTIPTGGSVWGHLGDGGYFENSGAATAMDILAAINRPEAARVLIIRYCDVQAENNPAADRWATEITSPPLALFRARDARGELALASLKAAWPAFAEFCLKPADPPLPLGWMLSASARAEINKQVVDAMDLTTGPAARVHGWMQ